MNEHGDQRSGIRQQTEVALYVANDLSVLARVFGSLAAHSQAIDGWRFYSDHGRAAILLVTSQKSKVPEVLRAGGFECETHSVVVLEQEHRGVSSVRFSAELRANGIQIVDAYTCGSLRNGTLLVLKTTDSSQAIVVLEAMNLLPLQSSTPQRGLVVDFEPVEA